MRQLKLLKFWRKASVFVIPKPNKLLKDPKSYRPISLLCVSFKILEDVFMSASNQLLIHCYLESKLGFGAKGRPYKSFFYFKKLRIGFWPKRRPALCLRISQQFTVLYGTEASPVNFSVIFGQAHGLIDY